MHIAFNAWFWNRPDTGSGQYLRGLVGGLIAAAPRLRLTLVAPQGGQIEPPPGVAAEHIALRGAGHLAKVRFEQQAFPRAAARLGADLAHIPYWGAPLSCPIPLIVTIHDLIPLLLPAYRGGMLARLYTGLVAASARGVSAVLTDSEHSQQDILKHLGLPPNRVHVTPLAVGEEYRPEPDSRDEAVRRKYDLPPEYVLYLGGYDVRKNVETLLRAYTYVRTGTGGSTPLVLAGRLPERITPRFTDVPALIQSMGAGDAVRLIGEVDEADKPALYRLAKCFVFPSQYEGFGLPVLEAMSCGTPVVAADTSSLPEIVGEAGFLVTAGDERHMAGSILTMLVQENVAGELREKGLARARQFSWQRTARATVQIYEEMLAQKRVR